MPTGVIVLFLAGLASFGLVQWRMLAGSPPAEQTAAIYADNEVELYRLFALHAVSYMKVNPTASGSIYWPTIATTMKLPAALANTGMPSTWRIVANGSTYVLCTDMKKKETPARIAKLVMEDRPERINRVSDKWVVGNPADATTLVTEAAKCS